MGLSGMKGCFFVVVFLFLSTSFEASPFIPDGIFGSHNSGERRVLQAKIPNPDDCSLVTGTIDGKFDGGYSITVNLGSEELKGVLYHIPTSANRFQGVSISHDAPPGFHKMCHAHEKGIGDNIGKLWS